MGVCRATDLIAFASSLDHVGPLTKTVKDAAIVLRDDRGTRSDGFDVRRVAGPRLRGGDWRSQYRGLKIGVAKEFLGEGLDAEVRMAVEAAIQKARWPGLRDRRNFSAAYEVRGADLLHRCHRGGVVEP